MPPKKRFDLSVVYEDVEGGMIQATVPAVPGTISVGHSRAEARDGVLDALAEMLAAPPRASTDSTELLRVRLDVDPLELGRAR